MKGVNQAPIPSTTTSSSASSHKPVGLPPPSSSASFWHSEPNTFLLNHRTTPTLPDHADIVIIGSGITGASMARYLASDPRAASLSVVMLEAREICWGATGRNGGHCQPLLFDRTPDVGAFEVKNVAAVREYIEEEGVECEWRSVTACRTFWSDEWFEHAKSEVEKLGREDPGLGGLVEVSSEPEVLKRYKVKASAKGVTLTKGAGQLWPYKYVSFIVEKLVRQGRINVQTHTPVVGIERVEGKEEGKGYRQVVKTPRGNVRAKHVLFATNGYTSHLLHDFSSIIVPVMCEMSALHPPKGSERLESSYGTVGFEGGNPEHDDYLIQRPFFESPNGDGKQYGGHLMFGGGRSYAAYECIGVTDDDIVDPGEADYLRQALLRILDLGGETEGLKELKASHQWTGIKGYSRDNFPWVGRVPALSSKDSEHQFSGTWEDGLWLCGGYTGHGMPNATLCAKAVVEMVLADGVDTYEDICRKLVNQGDLPEVYAITKERLNVATTLPSVEAQDAAGAPGQQAREQAQQHSADKGKSNCTSM